MAKFAVQIPCTMAIEVTVEASSKEEAKEKAFDVDFGVCIDKEFSDLSADPTIVEWEAHEQVTRGNVFLGVLNDIDVTEIKD